MKGENKSVFGTETAPDDLNQMLLRSWTAAEQTQMLQFGEHSLGRKQIPDLTRGSHIPEAKNSQPREPRQLGQVIVVCGYVRFFDMDPESFQILELPQHFQGVHRHHGEVEGLRS